MDVTRGASLAGEHYATVGDLVRLTLGNFDYDNCGFKENTSKDNIYYIGDVNESFILNEGDVITPLTEQTPGLLGTTARIPESGKYIQSQDVALIKCNPDLLDQDFAYYLLEKPGAYFQIGMADPERPITSSPHHNCHFQLDERGISEALEMELGLYLRVTGQM